MREPDKAQFADWVRQHRPFLYRAAWALTGERGQAQDLVQETFALAWRARGQLRELGAVRAWLYHILKREAMELWRQREPVVDWQAAANEAAWEHTPEIEARLDLLKALQDISEAHREILVLHYLSDLSYEQLALALEIPPGTVMSRLSRAREALRRVLEGRKDG
ncbi:MAG: RNA polymerase sigma factor [Burkholderiales bacterium]